MDGLAFSPIFFSLSPSNLFVLHIPTYLTYIPISTHAHLRSIVFKDVFTHLVIVGETAMQEFSPTLTERLGFMAQQSQTRANPNKLVDAE